MQGHKDVFYPPADQALPNGPQRRQGRFLGTAARRVGRAERAPPVSSCPFYDSSCSLRIGKPLLVGREVRPMIVATVTKRSRNSALVHAWLLLEIGGKELPAMRRPRPRWQNSPAKALARRSCMSAFFYGEKGEGTGVTLSSMCMSSSTPASSTPQVGSGVPPGLFSRTDDDGRRARSCARGVKGVVDDVQVAASGGSSTGGWRPPGHAPDGRHELRLQPADQHAVLAAIRSLQRPSTSEALSRCRARASTSRPA